MNRDLTWTLKQQPTAGELAELVKLNVLTAEEARAIATTKGKMSDASKVTTVVHMLLDASGSMESCRDSTIKGYNEYVNSLKKDGGKYKLSLTTFDSDIEGKLRLKKIHENVYVDDVPKLSRKTFVPNGGTPLHDAFCTVLKDAKARPDEKHLFVVLTDGGENMSRKYTANDMKELKSQYEDEGNWTFVYLGANQDAFATSQQFGYSLQNTSNFNVTPKGIDVMVASLSAATRSYSAAPSMSTGAFYTETQQKENEQTK
jgi:hypothetical protein